MMKNVNPKKGNHKRQSSLLNFSAQVKICFLQLSLETLSSIVNRTGSEKVQQRRKQSGLQEEGKQYTQRVSSIAEAAEWTTQRGQVVHTEGEVVQRRQQSGLHEEGKQYTQRASSTHRGQSSTHESQSSQEYVQNRQQCVTLHYINYLHHHLVRRAKYGQLQIKLSS